jgi:hypothetical protein
MKPPKIKNYPDSLAESKVPKRDKEYWKPKINRRKR